LRKFEYHAGRAVIFHASWIGRLKQMNSQITDNCRDFSRFVTRQTRKFYARAIAYGSYSDTLAARLLMMIGLGVMVGTTLWMVVASSIL
jgi:hypothetical protein